MSASLALLQVGSPPDQRLIIILGVIALATLVALGFKFFTNMFEVVTAPGASLGHHGRSDNFFFSMLIVFLGGLIATFVLIFSQDSMTQAFDGFAQAMAAEEAEGNSNHVYREVAAEWGANQLNSGFKVFVTNNLVFYPIVMIALWIVLGFVTFAAARMFGGQCVLGDFLGSLSYGVFFTNIGLGLLALFGVRSLQGFMGGQPPQPDVVVVVGGLLFLYGLILYVLAIVHAANLAGGQVVGVLVVLLIVLGGAGYGAYYYGGQAYQSLSIAIQSYNPAT